MVTAPADPPGARTARVVLLVANPAAPYSRGLRVARSLAAVGCEVEIAAVAADGLPLEEHEGAVTIRRYAPRGRFARWAVEAGTREAPSSRLDRIVDRIVWVVAWPVRARAWWATLERAVAPADLFHAFGILALPGALRLARRARRTGRRGRVIYDVIDVILESNNYDRVPWPLLAWFRWRERRWAGRADAIVTVNEPIADHLTRRWRLEQRPIVLLNAQPRWMPPAVRPDLIRAVTGLPSERRLVLFLGRLGRERGLDEAAEAVLRLDDAALVLLGFGPWAERLRERDGDPRHAGRHVTLPPVHPDEVTSWTASADVSLVAVPANSLNQRLSTPNKFWESLAAGTPIVVGEDLAVMRGIVERHGVGAVCDPLDPADIARALREILDLPPDEYEAMRTRCLRIAASEYHWERVVVPYLALVNDLIGRS